MAAWTYAHLLPSRQVADVIVRVAVGPVYDIGALVVVAEVVAEVVDVDMAVEPACGTDAAELWMKLALAGTVIVAVAVVFDDVLGVGVTVDVVSVPVEEAVAADVAVVVRMGVTVVAGRGGRVGGGGRGR